MGRTDVQDRVFICNDSFFKGNITASNITVEGEVIGDLKATSAVVIKNGGQVEGDIHADEIFLEKGFSHKGMIYLDDSTPKHNLTKEAKQQSNSTNREPGNNQSDQEQSMVATAVAE